MRDLGILSRLLLGRVDRRFRGEVADGLMNGISTAKIRGIAS